MMQLLDAPYDVNVSELDAADGSTIPPEVNGDISSRREATADDVIIEVFRAITEIANRGPNAFTFAENLEIARPRNERRTVGLSETAASKTVEVLDCAMERVRARFEVVLCAVVVIGESVPQKRN